VPSPEGELIPTRATLLQRLKDWQDQSSWQEFFDTYWKLIYGVARGAGMTDAEAQDVVQETIFSVARHMPTFKYDPTIGSFKAWLLNMTRWRIVDQLRKRGRPVIHRHEQREPSTGTRTTDEIVDPASQALEQLWEAEWQKALFDAAVAKIKRQIDPQKFQLFDLYVKQEWPADKVANTFGVPVDHVYLAKHRVTELIKEEVKRLEKEMT
jgi:RNA polymerase sigma-70 factor (ECF subfamily)